jgi:hypothetical protein
MFLTKKIKSSAIGYAITFMLLIALICSGVLFIASVNKRIETQFIVKEHLVFDNYFSLLYAAKNDLNGEHILKHPAGDSSHISAKFWGSYKMLVVNTKHQNSSIKRTALIAYEMDEDLPVLYLPENQQALKVGGATRIEGTAYLSDRGIDRAYIAGKNYLFNELIFGNTKQSERTLPPLKKEVTNLGLENFSKDCEKKDFLAVDSVYSFSEKTTLFSQIEPIVIRNSLSGNLIIHSFDSIYVSKEARLKNVILIAPIVRFQEGFSGTAQVIAHQTISLEKNVHLNYPSTLCLNELESNTLGKKSSILLQEDSKVLGGILIETQQYNFRNEPYLKISQKALVAGLVYNVGETELNGKLIGHLYTQKFILSAGGGVYVNHLLDATLSSKLLPKTFLLPSWLEQIKSKQAKIISCF